jgi:hypothetical protein
MAVTAKLPSDPAVPDHLQMQKELQMRRESAREQISRLEEHLDDQRRVERACAAALDAMSDEEDGRPDEMEAHLAEPRGFGG